MSQKQDVWHWPKNIYKSIWGPRGWRWLHTLAINHPLHPSEKLKYDTHIRIWNFISNLPCDYCRRHALSYMLGNPPRLDCTHVFQQWVWRFHNAVNERLKKPQISFRDYQRAYNLLR